MRDARKSITLQHTYFKELFSEHSRNKLFLPMIEKSSIWFNLRALTRSFCKVMHKIQDRMRDIMQMNRAKLNYLQIIWDD